MSIVYQCTFNYLLILKRSRDFLLYTKKETSGGLS